MHIKCRYTSFEVLFGDACQVNVLFSMPRFSSLYAFSSPAYRILMCKEGPLAGLAIPKLLLQLFSPLHVMLQSPYVLCHWL